MNTSYFAGYHGDKGVSIAIRSPKGFIGTSYSLLFPDWWFLSDYFKNHDEDLYTKRYQELVLSKLDPEEVFNDLKDSVILCWESPEKFCHRFIVAKWIEDNIGIEVKEL